MRAFRQGGKLFIELDEDALVAGVTLSTQGSHVVDRERFLDFCAKQICVFGDSGDWNSASELTRLLDKLAVEAEECDAGVECELPEPPREDQP